MLSQIFKSSFIYSIGRVLPQAISFILLPVYTFYISKGDYGIVNSMQVFSAVLMLFLTFALDRGVLRLYYDYDEEIDKKNFLGTISISIFILSSIVMVVTFYLQDFSYLLFSSISFYPYFLLTIATTFLQTFSLLPLIFLQIKKRPVSYTFLALGNFLMGLILTLYFIIILNQGAYGMLKALFFSSLTLVPFYIYISIKNFSFAFDIKYLKKTLAFTIPMIPTLIASWLLNLSDRIFIEKFFNVEEVGLYSLGAKIAGLIIIIFGAFQVAYSPYFYELAKDIKNKPQLVFINNIILKVFCFISFLLCFFSRELIQLFFNPIYYDAINVINILGLSSVISVFLGVLNLSYYQAKATLALMYILLVGGAVNLVFNYFLIPNYSYIGASIATVISFLIMFIIQLYYSKKYYHLDMKWHLKLLQLLYYVTIVYIVNYKLNLNLLNGLILKSLILVIILTIEFFSKDSIIKYLCKNYLVKKNKL
jgi:O-antigen/teichoic acid export membrane protein